MIPVSSPNDIRNSLFCYTVFVAKHSEGDDIRHVLLANFDNLSLGKFYIADMASLFCHVCHVVGMSAKEKVRNAYAAWIVTMVTYLHAIRDWTVFQFPSEAVSKYQFSTDARTHLPVTKRMFVSSPFPTAIRTALVDLFPKAFDGRTALIVPMDKVKGLTFDPTARLVREGCRFCQLPASALAITVWNFVRGIIEGHSDLQSLCQRSGRFQRRRPTFLKDFIIPQMGGAF